MVGMELSIPPPRETFIAKVAKRINSQMCVFLGGNLLHK